MILSLNDVYIPFQTQSFLKLKSFVLRIYVLLKDQQLWGKYVITVQPTSVLTMASVWYEIRVLSANINHFKSHAMAMAFNFKADIN